MSRGLPDDERGPAEHGANQADTSRPPPAGPDPVVEYDHGWQSE
ncbi:Uncharacterised protein [Amycolatopsis camponoti]|uniref:Uncharacterized protein n=1 Tax=Amycolatopsis camponoti TaxID=2606593 RepID=A0A6I8LWS5_9PSEU|nr:Uncharacterised protein [Amycolatopsis camponoti]